MTVELLKPTLSPSALSEYEICLRRGQFYHDPDIPRVTTLGLGLGGAWHKAMETYGQARLQTGDGEVAAIDPGELVDRLYQVALGHLIEVTNQDDFVWSDDDDIGETSEQLWAMLNAWAADPGARWMDGYTTIEDTETEVRAEFDSPTHQIHGYIDAVYRVSPPGKPILGPVLVDYKTASRAWSHTKAGDGKGDGNPRRLIQAPLYAEAWLRTTGEDVTWFAYDVMTYAGKFERVWVDVCSAVRKPFIQRWQRVAEMIDRYGHEPLPTNPGAMLCSEKWCSYWTYCEMGEGLARASEREVTT